MRRSIAVAALFAAFQASAAWSQVSTDQPRIIVDGNGEVKTMPDEATINYTLRGEGTTSDEAVKAMVSQGKTIHAMLRTVDNVIEPRTDDFHVMPVKGNACKDGEYDYGDKLSTGDCAI